MTYKGCPYIFWEVQETKDQSVLKTDRPVATVFGLRGRFCFQTKTKDELETRFNIWMTEPEVADGQSDSDLAKQVFANYQLQIAN